MFEVFLGIFVLITTLNRRNHKILQHHHDHDAKKKYGQWAMVGGIMNRLLQIPLHTHCQTLFAHNVPDIISK